MILKYLVREKPDKSLMKILLKVNAALQMKPSISAGLDRNNRK
jgi:hypothetical protein